MSPLNHEHQNENTTPALEVVDSDVPASIDMSNVAEMSLFLDKSGESDESRNFRLVNLSEFPRDSEGRILYGDEALNPNLEFLLLQGSEEPDFSSGKGYKGLRRGEGIMLGRGKDNPLRERFDFPDTVSREHAFLALSEDGKVLLEDLKSTNGVSYRLESSNEQFAGKDSSAESPLDTMSESEKEFLKAFPVINAPESVPESKYNRYDLLFMDDGPEKEDLERAIRDEDAKNQPLVEARRRYEDLVSDESRDYSKAMLETGLGANPQIKGILAENGYHSDTGEMVDAIRTNPKVRARVAMHLSQKLDKATLQSPDMFGERITNNSYNNMKTDHVTGQKWRSRDYAIKLALDMLGGSFSERREGSDPIEYDDANRPIRGQHRAAARDLIFVP